MILRRIKQLCDYSLCNIKSRLTILFITATNNERIVRHYIILYTAYMGIVNKVQSIM